MLFVFDISRNSTWTVKPVIQYHTVVILTSTISSKPFQFLKFISEIYFKSQITAVIVINIQNCKKKKTLWTIQRIIFINFLKINMYLLL